MRTIPQRELRNQISDVLRTVATGERLRVTVDGRSVTDLVPVDSGEDVRRTFVARARVERLLAQAPLDLGFTEAVGKATDATIDDL